jgi:hypothetical protein
VCLDRQKHHYLNICHSLFVRDGTMIIGSGGLFGDRSRLSILLEYPNMLGARDTHEKVYFRVFT